jgi:copper oxidase (laccase) domain-containing protein
VSEVQRGAEQFAALSALREVVHGFTLRVPGLEMTHDKAEALARLDGVHHAIRNEFELGAMAFVTAQQVHGNRIAIVDSAPDGNNCFDECDGLITNRPGICLGIYVADCCAVYLVDPVKQAIGLVHSGKKGTELRIAGKAIEAMTASYGSRPSDLVVELSPCIRPPHYEIDFAAEIVRQCREAGVGAVHDSGLCTACDLARYYSYRAEKGRTGRMLAFMALRA